MQRLSLFGLPVLAALLSARAEAGHVAIFRANLDGSGSVRSVDVDGAGPIVHPTALQEIRLLDIEASGRAELFELDPSRPRLRTDVPGVARLELPHHRGSLYRFSRAAADGSSAYGFFLVDAQGDARVLFERSSANPTAGDPLVPRVAVSPDGAAILVATTYAGGGDLFVVDVASGAAHVLTAAIPPVEVQLSGLVLGATQGCAVTYDGVLRFPRTPDAVAEWVPFVGATATATPMTWYGDVVVPSNNGDWFAVVASDQGPFGCLPFVFGATGPARPAGTTPRRFGGSGFEPEFKNGPYLAVSDDGATVAWRVRNDGAYALGNEIYVNSVSTTMPEFHLTQDAIFEPYLDEVALFVFRPDGKLLFGVADAPTVAGAGMTRMDLFAMTPASGASAPVVQNLSLSSTQVSPPYLLLPQYVPLSVRWLPEADAFLMHVSEGVDGRVLRVPSSGAVVTAFQEVTSIDVLERAGSDLVLSLVGHDGDEQDLRSVPSTLASSPDDVPAPEHGLLRSPVVDPSGWIAYVVQSTTCESVWIVRADSDVSRVFYPRGMPVGPTLTFTNQGTAAFTLRKTDGTSILASLTATGPARRVPISADNYFVLP